MVIGGISIIESAGGMRGTIIVMGVRGGGVGSV